MYIYGVKRASVRTLLPDAAEIMLRIVVEAREALIGGGLVAEVTRH